MPRRNAGAASDAYHTGFPWWTLRCSLESSAKSKMQVVRGKFGIFGACARAAWIALCVLCAQPAAASPPLSVQRYTLEEGLSQQAVNAITQDADGFMWFGTEDGLNRFDGYEFRQLRHDRADVHSLPNGWISSLVATDEGLWIATDGGG